MRDGRGVDLYHKSEIDADLKDLDKFTDTGELKPRVSVYNKQLKLDIDTEIDAMETAYRQLCEAKDKTRITAEDFEEAITSVLHPQKNMKALTELTLIDRFSKYIEDGLRDGNFGEGRQKHYKVSLGELTRFLTIQHRLKVTPSEFDADDLMDFRQFLFDEYKYVDKHKSLYDMVKPMPLIVRCRCLHPARCLAPSSIRSPHMPRWGRRGGLSFPHKPYPCGSAIRWVQPPHVLVLQAC